MTDKHEDALFTDAVKELVEFCKRGSSGAKVTHVNVQWENYTGKFQDFKIRYSF